MDAMYPYYTKLKHLSSPLIPFYDFSGADLEKSTPAVATVRFFTKKSYPQLTGLFGKCSGVII